MSPTAVPTSPCRRIKAICASLNFDLFIVLLVQRPESLVMNMIFMADHERVQSVIDDVVEGLENAVR
jgi:hypothetical protein